MKGNDGRRPSGRALGSVLAWIFFWILLWTVPAALAATNTNPAARKQSELRATLENGLRVVIVRNPLAPVVTTVVNYLVGSNEAPDGFPGMAHAQEHMMFRGSPDLSAGQLADIAASMGGDFDAATQQVATQYFFTVPAEDLDVALHIEAIRMRGVLDSEALWQQERGAIEQEVAQDLSNPEYLLYTRLLQSLFAGTVYAHDALGSRESFQKTTGPMLKKFFDTWYVPNNAILIIVGDVDPPKALAQVKALFSGIPSKKLPPRPAIKLGPVSPQTISLQTDLPYGEALIAFRMPGSDNPDYAAVQVLSDVLSSQRGRLWDLVPSGEALTAGFSYSALPKAGIGYAQAQFPGGEEGTALAQKIKQILIEVTQKGVQPDLVDAAKRMEIASEEFQKNSVTGLAMAWSEALAVEGRQSPDDDVRAIERVTVDDVNRVARTYLDPAHAIVAVLTPQPSGAPVSTKAFGGKESFTPKETTGAPLPAWAQQAVSRVAVPQTTVHPTVSTLPNGITLIVQPESVSDTVIVSGHIKNRPQMEEPKGKEGVEEILNQLFPYGTTSLDRLAFQEALDNIAASVSAGTDFSLQVLATQFERGLALLADNELHPALPEPAFKVTQKQTAAALAGERQSPDYLTSRTLTTALFPKDDPALREATPETVKSLTMADVKTYYQQVYRPDMTTIVVIGNVTPERARSAVEKFFGGWQAAGPKPETLLPPAPPNKPMAMTVPNSSRVQDKVILGETLGLVRTDPDYYALQLGNHVLGGAFYATRLYRDLREQTGLVYFVSTNFEVGETRSVYMVNYACDPPNVSKAHAIILRNLKAMQSTPVSAKELQQAKALVLREIPLSESSEERIASGLIYRASHSLPLDEPIRAAQRYVALTADQVQKAFAKWLRPEDLVQVTEGPAPQ